MKDVIKGTMKNVIKGTIMNKIFNEDLFHAAGNTAEKTVRLIYLILLNTKNFKKDHFLSLK